MNGIKPNNILGSFRDLSPRFSRFAAIGVLVSLTGLGVVDHAQADWILDINQITLSRLAQSGQVQPGQAQPGLTQSGQAHQPSPATHPRSLIESETAPSNPAHLLSDARSGDTLPSDSRFSDALPSDVRPSDVRPSEASQTRTISPTIYRADLFCQTLEPQIIALNVPATRGDRQAEIQAEIQAAIGAVLKQWMGSDGEIAGYRVTVRDRVAMIDLRRDPGAVRPWVALSTCEQFALFGALRTTIVNETDWGVDRVEFRSLDQPLTF